MYMANARTLCWGPIFQLLGVCAGGNATFSVCVGVKQMLAFLDSNMLVYPTQNSRIGGIAQHESFRVTVEYIGLSLCR